jgi:hypothetical protein
VQNKVLQAGIPLPTFPNFNFTTGELTTQPGFVLLGLNFKLA